MLISKSILRQVVIVMSGRYVFFLSLETTRHANPVGYFLPLFFFFIFYSFLGWNSSSVSNSADGSNANDDEGSSQKHSPRWPPIIIVTLFFSFLSYYFFFLFLDILRPCLFGRECWRITIQRHPAAKGNRRAFNWKTKKIIHLFELFAINHMIMARSR